VASLTVTAKGQVTLRKDVLKHLGVKPGDKIEIDLLPDKKVSIRPRKTGATLNSFIGCLKSPDGPELSLDEIKKLIEEGWAGVR
jgi:antitoxin PrlF